MELLNQAAVSIGYLTTASSGGGDALVPHVWSVIPFIALLLCIAILPLKASHWFEHNKNKAIVATACGGPALAYLFIQFPHDAGHLALHSAVEYIQFLCLLASLYAISGNIYVTGNLVGNPMTNAAFLGIGAVLANLIGTTGAAMVLIRPVLRANSERIHKQHVIIFFIFVVCNCGGLLTPLGDPPLFLGFLRGVDFFWTLQLLPNWALTNGIVIAVYFAFEAHYYKKETITSIKQDAADYVPMGIAGKVNFLFLAGVIGAVLASQPLGEIGEKIHFPFVREIIMLTMTMLSLKSVDQGPRKSNNFNWAAIQEVGILFAGIFAAMIPALMLLEARGAELGLSSPAHYFWASGILSSFLDNAPTYLTFTTAAVGQLSHESAMFAGFIAEAAGKPGANYIALMNTTMLPEFGVSASRFLAAVSCGSVFMGANSYIGNAPNFMVKSIAEGEGVAMPSFFGYMAYSGIVLIPIFAIQTFIFFM